MPELPEVEVTRRRIAPRLVGRRIRAVTTTADSYFFLTKPAPLEKGLVGRTVTSLSRHGKYLLAELDDHKRLLLHLGMTGQLFTDDASSVRLLSSTSRSSLAPDEQRGFQPDQHTHLCIDFDDGGVSVLFRDVRKFGKVRLLSAGERDPRLERLGVDALELSAEQLWDASRRRKVAIKNLLLSQTVVAGIGNIYADEALFLARVRPTRRAGKLTRAECERLVGAARQVLLRSIETGGSSISDYVAPDGEDGAYQDERRAYSRTGEPCLDCGTPIKRVVLAQRGTHFCPSCQR